MSVLLSDSEIQNLKKMAITEFAINVLADINECALNKDVPVLMGEGEIDTLVRMSDVENVIRSHMG